MDQREHHGIWPLSWCSLCDGLKEEGFHIDSRKRLSYSIPDGKDNES